MQKIVLFHRNGALHESQSFINGYCHGIQLKNRLDGHSIKRECNYGKYVGYYEEYINGKLMLRNKVRL
jgi:antitoxin component YwqK of YwqJK toxin-antitoxin module